MEQDRPVVTFDGVSKAFGDRRVLEDLSFELRRGDVLCLLGRSGSGKSVTLRLLIGLLSPDRGRIEIDGRSVPDLDRPELDELRRSIGFLFQEGALFDSLTVGENVAFPLRRHTDHSPDEIRQESERRLAQVGLEKEYETMPGALSGGMRKRAALARALALDPWLLLVDEPSAGLDPITCQEIGDLFADLEPEVTMIMVSHDLYLPRRLASTLAILDGGKIVAEGSAQELAESSHPLARRFFSSPEDEFAPRTERVRLAS